MNSEVERLYQTQLERYQQHDQGHVFAHYSEIPTDEEKLTFLRQLESIEVESLSRFLSSARKEQEALQNKTKDDNGNDNSSPMSMIRPFSGTIGSMSVDINVDNDISNNTNNKNNTMKEECYQLGMNAIQTNSVAVVLLAGGQGTRLGFDGPKGIYDFGLRSRKTLFALVAERIFKLIQLAKAKADANERQSQEGGGEEEKIIRIPLYIMTSPMNDQITRDYFQSNNFFNLPPQDVIFFAQGVLPCLSSTDDPNNDGKILLESPSKCAMAPDGNGGIYAALRKHGLLLDMTNRKIQHVHTFAIDNALTKPADPLFIGYCLRQGADCGNKTVRKIGPHEKMGVVAEKILNDGKGAVSVVEYSELSKEMAEMVLPNTRTLAFGAGNICNHYYTLSFLIDKVIPNMGDMYHIAHKKIPVWDESTRSIVTPTTKPNGMKLESFIFDVFPLSRNMAILEVERECEFAPIKNPPGASSDSPDTARRMISILAKKWLVASGANLMDKGDSDLGYCCEISPLTSYGGEGLECYHGKDVACPFSI